MKQPTSTTPTNRHYSSQWGRFLTPDPYVAPQALTDPQAWNRYAYVENDPVNVHDPPYTSSRRDY